MREFRAATGALVTIVIFAAMAIAGPQLLQDEIEQRVSGLEARVTVLEQQVAELQTNGASAPATAVSAPDPTAPAAPATSHHLRGLITVYVELGHEETVGTPCSGAAQSAEAGARITIYDSNKRVIATTELLPGTFGHETTIDDTGNLIEYTTCVLPFSIPRLPDSAFYEITMSGVGGSLVFSRQELAAMDWILRLGNE